jgi:transketolase
MRDAFVRALTAIALQDPNTMLLTGDLGFGVLTDYARAFPKQYLNVGVAEQNMTGVAVGLALAGKTVFTYSIGNFPTLRCLEQIRNDVCYHNANVKIVCIGGGLCYGALGISHHATEDLAIMRALPNLTVVAPGDTEETSLATRAVYEQHGPCYLRLGRGGEANVHVALSAFELGKAIMLFSEGDIAVLSIGGILSNVVAARKLLEVEHISASLHSLHTLNPLDRDVIERLAASAILIVTVEEHSIIGGLGGAVAEILAELSAPKARLIRIGLPAGFSSEVGDQEYLRGIYGLSPHAIASRILAEFRS